MYAFFKPNQILWTFVSHFSKYSNYFYLFICCLHYVSCWYNFLILNLKYCLEKTTGTNGLTAKVPNRIEMMSKSFLLPLAKTKPWKLILRKYGKFRIWDCLCTVPDIFLLHTFIAQFTVKDLIDLKNIINKKNIMIY